MLTTEDIEDTKFPNHEARAGVIGSAICVHQLRDRTLRNAPERFQKNLSCALWLRAKERCSCFRRWKSPGLPSPKIFITRKEDIIGILFLSKPADDVPNGAFRHNRTSCRGAIRAPLDVKENSAAGTGHGWVRIVANFDEPAMRRIVKTHLLLFKPRGRISWVYYHVLVVVWQRGVINPSIGLRNCVKGIFRTPGKAGS